MVKRGKFIINLLVCIIIVFYGSIIIQAEDVKKNINVNEVYTDTSFSNNNYYYFTIENDGYINFEFNHENLTSNVVGWFIKLYDKDSNFLTEIGSYQNKTKTKSCNIGLPKGEYYICVEPYYSSVSDISYELKINYQQSSKWEKEFNENISTAQTINLNQTINGSIIRDSDKDFYKIYLKSNGYINFEFNHENLTSNVVGWFIKLYDKDSNFLTEISSYQNKTKTKSCNIGLPKGEYYICVEPYYSVYADYNLKINYKKTTTWEKEFNETILTSNPIKLNTTINGSIRKDNDNDYFKITLKKKTKLRIKFSHKNFTDSSVGWFIELYDNNSNKLIDIASKNNAKSTNSDFFTLPKGTYYVLVKPYYINTANYKLTLSTK